MIILILSFCVRVKKADLHLYCSSRLADVPQTDSHAQKLYFVGKFKQNFLLFFFFFFFLCEDSCVSRRNVAQWKNLLTGVLELLSDLEPTSSKVPPVPQRKVHRAHALRRGIQTSLSICSRGAFLMKLQLSPGGKSLQNQTPATRTVTLLTPNASRTL